MMLLDGKGQTGAGGRELTISGHIFCASLCYRLNTSRLIISQNKHGSLENLVLQKSENAECLVRDRDPNSARVGLMPKTLRAFILCHASFQG